MTKFKVGDCIRCDEFDLFGEIIEIHKGKENYRIQWCDDTPQITNESIEAVDYSFIKISRVELITLAM